MMITSLPQVGVLPRLGRCHVCPPMFAASWSTARLVVTMTSAAVSATPPAVALPASFSLGSYFVHNVDQGRWKG